MRGSFIDAGAISVTSVCDLQHRDIAFCRRWRAVTDHVVRQLWMGIPGTCQQEATCGVLLAALHINALWAGTTQSNTIASIRWGAVSIATHGEFYCISAFIG